MKTFKSVLLGLLFCFFMGIAHADKIVDIDLKSNLIDKKGNLTSGAVSRGSAATYVDHRGILRTAAADRDQLIDTDAQNDVTDTWWSRIRLVSVVNDGIVANTDNNSHYIRRSNLISDGSTVIFHAEMAAGAVDWVELRVVDTVNKGVTFDLSNGVIGTVDSSVIGGISSVGDGYYLCWIIASITGTTGDAYILPGPSDGTIVFAGDGSSVSTYVRNVMLEELPSGNVIYPESIEDQVNRDFSGASDWTNNNINSYDETGDLTITASASGQYCTLAAAKAPMTQNESYTLEFDVANIVGAWTISDFDAGFTIGTISANGTDKQIVFQYTDASSGGFRITADDNNSSMNLNNISLKRIPDLAYMQPSAFINSATIPAEPRHEADGLLIEGASINISSDNDMSNWTETAGAQLPVSANAIGPDGQTSAFEVTDTGTSSAGRFLLNVGQNEVVNGQPYCLSVFIKQGSSSSGGEYRLYEGSPTNVTRIRLSWSWTDGVPNLTLNTGDRSGSEQISNGWWRIWAAVDSLTWAGASSNNSIILYVTNAGYTPASDETNIFYGSQLENNPYVTSYIPTTGAPTARLTEAGSATNGYSWTMGAAVTDALAAAGTLVTEWQALQDYDTEDMGNRGLVSVNDSSAVSVLYFLSTEGTLASYDGTNAETLAVNWSSQDSLISVVRWDETLNGGAGYLHALNKLNDTWNLNAAGEAAFDGGFIMNTTLRLSFLNELPIKIGRLIMYDTYLSDSEVQAEGWNIRRNSPFHMGMSIK